jgi:hypothetical protein
MAFGALRWTLAMKLWDDPKATVGFCARLAGIGG